MKARLRQALRQLHDHRHCLIFITLLTLAVTFPTIVYVFKTDVFWHPGGDHPDTFIKLWDVWYGKQFLTGQADRFYTNYMFYPEGVSLKYHPFFLPYIISVNAFAIFLPLLNAVSLGFILVVISSALAAYIYVLWIFRDKWVALLGAVIFGLSPHVIGHPYHIDTAWIATIPLVLYFFHRGVVEDRRLMVATSGLLVGLTSTVIPYTYVIVLILLGFFLCAFAISRWRESRFWLNVLLLIVAIALSSIWTIYPLVSNSDALGTAIAWHGADEINSDALSFFVNYGNPLYGRLFDSIAQTSVRSHVSTTSFLGFVPLLLVCFGFLSKATRRKMLPWSFLCALFLILRLGSSLNIKGIAYPDIRLPKFYLDQIAPDVFGAFWEVDNFMMGALLPLAVLACCGLVALQKRYAIAAKPKFILALVLIVALEYYIPVQTDRVFPVGDGAISEDRFAFLDWLAQEDEDSIRLINLPMGRRNSKTYNLYQLLSGYPHAEGAISRTPDNAFEYIRENFLLNAWHNQQPVSCDLVDRQDYLSGLAQLEANAFSHVVYHHEFRDWMKIADSFRNLVPDYRDEYVSIFRLSRLSDGCSEEVSARLAFTSEYAKALQQPAFLDERPGVIVIFPPTAKAADHYLRYHPRFADINRTVLTVAQDEQGSTIIGSSELPDSDSSIHLEQYAALWLFNDRLAHDGEQTAAFQDWFQKRYELCERNYEETQVTIDLYLRSGIPCAALDASSALDVHYDSGLRLHNLSYHINSETVRFFLAWTRELQDSYGYSLQFFEEAGNKALQQDSVVSRQLLQVMEINIASLQEGVYSVQLIVYDFDTQISQGGTVLATGEYFERALEVARITVARD